MIQLILPKASRLTFHMITKLLSPDIIRWSMDDLKTELTVTSRCAIHKYTFRQEGNNYLAIDLKHGSTGACTIVAEDDYDTVKISGIKIIDSSLNRRISGSQTAGQRNNMFIFMQNFQNHLRRLKVSLTGKDVIWIQLLLERIYGQY